MPTDRRYSDTAPVPTLDRSSDASLDIVPFDAVDGFASAECEIEFDDAFAFADALDTAPPDPYGLDDGPVLDPIADFVDDGDIEATMDYAREAAIEPAPEADAPADGTIDYARGVALEPTPDPDGPAGQTADLGVRDDPLEPRDAIDHDAAPDPTGHPNDSRGPAPQGRPDEHGNSWRGEAPEHASEASRRAEGGRPARAGRVGATMRAEGTARAPKRRGDPAPQGRPDEHGQLDYDALDAPVDGPTGTADFGSSPPLLDDLEAAEPEPEPEPRGDAGPPPIATAWTERLTAAADDLVIAHARGQTWRGRFGIGDRGLTGQPAAARSDAELDADVARLHALLTAAAAVVRQDATRAPAAIVVADALARLESPTDAPALARALRRALYTRTRKRRARLDAEADAVEARRRALQSQRRLRADLAARLARLDASIAAQDAAVRRDEARAVNLDAERADLDGVFDRVDVPSDPPTTGGAVRKVETSDPGDAVRRLLAVGSVV